jgi:hypothetical protein
LDGGEDVLAAVGVLSARGDAGVGHDDLWLKFLGGRLSPALLFCDDLVAVADAVHPNLLLFVVISLAHVASPEYSQSTACRNIGQGDV